MTNLVTPSILSMTNNFLIAITETTTKEDEGLSTYSYKGDNVAYFNADIYLNVGVLSNFIDSAEKDDVVNYVNSNLCIMLRIFIDTCRSVIQDI